MDEFEADVALMVENAKAYNEEGSDIVRWVELLKVCLRMHHLVLAPPPSPSLPPHTYTIFRPVCLRYFMQHFPNGERSSAPIRRMKDCRFGDAGKKNGTAIQTQVPLPHSQAAFDEERRKIEQERPSEAPSPARTVPGSTHVSPATRTRRSPGMIKGNAGEREREMFGLQ